MEIRGKVALVTGGARIGSVVAEEIARRGCHIVLTYRSSKDAAVETARRAETLGVRSLVVRADTTKASDVKGAFRAIQRAFGRLDILVNLVSAYGETPWRGLDERAWKNMIDSNLASAQLAVLHGAPLMKKGGRIVHFADWVAASGRPRYKNFVPYYAAKAGLIGLMQAQALELAPRILVNCVAPGPILPPPGSSRAVVNGVKKVTPLKRWGGALEIAKAVLFLLETDFVTGECIRVDGGRHLF